MQKDFWELDQSIMTKENIASKAQEHFSEDFIENYPTWQQNIRKMNVAIKEAMKTILPEEEYKEMKFDEFCQKILDGINNIIMKNGRYYTTDIPFITLGVREDFARKLLMEYHNKIYSSDGILNSIKKVYGSK